MVLVQYPLPPLLSTQLCEKHIYAFFFRLKILKVHFSHVPPYDRGFPCAIMVEQWSTIEVRVCN